MTGDFYEGQPSMPSLAFVQPACRCVPQQLKTDPRARPYFFLNFDYNYGCDCSMILDATTEMVVYSRDVTWHETRQALISPARTSETGTRNHAPTPEYVFIPPPAAAPVNTPSPEGRAKGLGKIM